MARLVGTTCKTGMEYASSLGGGVKASTHFFMEDQPDIPIGPLHLRDFLETLDVEDGNTLTYEEFIRELKELNDGRRQKDSNPDEGSDR